MANLKETIVELGHEHGFHHVVIGGLAPLVEGGLIYQSWVDQGFAASMDYLKRDPRQRVEPERTFPGSRSVIIASVSYYSEPDTPTPAVAGKVARYAVGLDYHPTIRRKMREFAQAIEKNCQIKLNCKPFTDDVALYEQSLAARHGLGFVGKNSLILGPQLSGSYNFIAELFVDVELEPDLPYVGTCGKCFRCGNACPTDAIKDGALIDSHLCISFLTIENKGGIAPGLRSKLGDWVYGCDICQEVCPYNSKPVSTPWAEFLPQAGVGHHLDLLDIMTIKDELEFRGRFEKSPVRRPKRRGLLRNALVVLGNHLANAHRESDRIVQSLVEFTQSDQEDMLVEHAAWALAQSQESSARKALIALVARRGDGELRAELQNYLH
ncbi:MAG: tRNA epoxyqueuosine(34) reductase QueG [Cyanobacteria bacterium REEB67]|nr:tRNA epoxyqueuosine(34) reductase QueG [Cyanobacteria bacterium REEB67]